MNGNYYQINGVNGTNRMNGHSDDILVNGNGAHHFNPKSYDDILLLTETIRNKVQIKEIPTIGIICGSGLGELGDIIQDKEVIPYTKIPGFPPTNVVGHKGNLVFGYLGRKYVVCLQGRFHPYEHNMDMALCAAPVRLLHQLGVETLIVSNAAGGVNPKFNYGDLMAIKDHIFLPGMMGFSPFVGLNDSRFGPRFVSVHDAYDRNLRHMAKEVAKEQAIPLHEGVYCMTAGPQYETPAEVTMLKSVGADAVGMSTAHEVTVARQCGIRVFGFSLITNIANTDSDTSVEITHEEVLQAAKEVGTRACKFVTRIIEKL